MTHTRHLHPHELPHSHTVAEHALIPQLSHHLFARSPSLRMLLNYAASVGIIGLTSGLLWVLQHHVGIPNVAMFYLVAVIGCAAIGGRGPAIFSALVSFLTFKYLFVPPIFSFTIDDAGDIYQLSSLVATALIGGGLTLRAQAQAANARRHAYEQALLYELSQTLSSELDVQRIAHTIVTTTWSLLPCESCLIVIDPGPDRDAVQIEIGTQGARVPTFAAPIQVRDTQFGTLHVLLTPKSAIFEHSYQRLFQAMATQAGLALERSQLVHQLAHTEALAESDRLKSTLLSAVSHDLRTPLAAITAAADELRSDDVAWTPAAAAGFAQLISTKARYLDTLVTNMLDLTRIEAGVLQPRRSWYHVAEIVYRVLDRLETELRGRTIAVDVPDELPLVPIDYIQIEQVLWNLIQNAIKYSPATTPLLIRATLGESTLCLQIGDRGPGIPPHARERVFEKFARLPEHEQSGISGAGVGLTICKGIIDAHGGQISITDQDGGGTVIVIHLPLTITPSSREVQ